MPTILVSGPVIVENESVLLNKHGDTPFWKFCGGKCETLSVSLVDTAKREAKEEVGIDLEILDSRPFLFWTQKTLPDGEIADVILVHYLAKRIGDIRPGADIREWGWVPLSSLAQEDLAPNIVPALQYFGFLSA